MEGSEKNRHFLCGLFPNGFKSGSPQGQIGPGVMPAVKLAIKHINQSPNILHGYKLKMVWNDTECNPGVGLKSFFDMVHIKPKKLVLFGAACSPVTDQIAKAAKHWNLVQLTYADTHPMFTEESFPHFFRVVPSDNEFNPPRLSIMKYYNWTRVGTLYQNEAKYALAHNNLVSELEKSNFTIVGSQSFNDEITDQLDILIEKDVRIILGNFNESWARVVFCDAYHKGVYGKKYQWLIVGMYQDQWWTKGMNETKCTAGQIPTALLGAMVMDILPLASNEEITVSKRTPGEYEEEYKNSTQYFSRYHGYAYDGIWAAALAIQEVGRRARKEYNVSLADFDYRSKDWEKLFIEALDRTSFEGVTGPVRFRENSRRGNVVIKQLVHHGGKMTERCIGEYSGVTRTLYLERCGKVFWAADRPPKDRTIIKIEEARVNITIYIILVIVASLGIVLASVFLIVNIKFRKQRQIKMSSPNMNNLIIIGCILTYTSVILLGLDSHLTSEEAFPYICTARAWILMSGFTLSFGSMFSKTWRVHSIFTNVQLNKKVMKDSQLYLVIIALISIDIIIMTTWQILDPFYRQTKKLEPYSLDSGDGVTIIPRIEFCVSSHMTIFVGCIYAYKGLLMLFGAFLAWETRHVQIPALNDSKYVGMSVYNVAIMCVLGVAVTFVLKNQINASFIIIAIFIIFCTTGTLCLVFVPKLIDLQRDPYGTMDKRGKPTIKANIQKKTPLQTMEDKLRIANKVNNKYKELLNDLDADLKEAIEELGEEESDRLLETKTTNAKLVGDTRKDTHVSFAIDVNDISSTASERTSSQFESSSNQQQPVNGKPMVNPENQLLTAPGLNNHHHLIAPAETQKKMEMNGGGVMRSNQSGPRPSTSSTITSDYFSMNSNKENEQMNPAVNISSKIGQPQRIIKSYEPIVEDVDPMQEGLAENLYRRLSGDENDTRRASSRESIHSDYTEDDDDYDGCRRRSESRRTESQSCQTYYENQATQTDDEDERGDETCGLIGYGYPTDRRRSQDFSPNGDDCHDDCEGYYSKTNSLRYPKGGRRVHCVNNSNRACCCQPKIIPDNTQHQWPSKSIHNMTAVDSIEILPIFHKLLEDKRGSDVTHQPNNPQPYHPVPAPPQPTRPTQPYKKPIDRFNAARSCPDMSVRCDIVEYL